MHLSPLAHIPTHHLLSVTVWDSYLLSKTMWGSRLLSMIELFPTFLIPKPPYPGCWSSKYSSSPILKLSLYQFTFSLEICSNLLVKKKKQTFKKISTHPAAISLFPSQPCFSKEQEPYFTSFFIIPQPTSIWCIAHHPLIVNGHRAVSDK